MGDGVGVGLELLVGHVELGDAVYEAIRELLVELLDLLLSALAPDGHADARAEPLEEGDPLPGEPVRVAVAQVQQAEDLVAGAERHERE